MRIRAIAHALPGKRITNDAMIAEVLERSRGSLECDPAELERQLRVLLRLAGTEIRFHRAPGETALEFGRLAGERALQQAEMQPSDIDLLIYVGVGRGFIEPATFNVFQDVLKLTNATGFDVLDACASWMRAVHIAESFIRGGVYRNVMILNAEFNFREYADLTVRTLDELAYKFPTFTMGEAATATIISDDGAPAGQDGYFGGFVSIGSAHDLCKIPLPNLRQYSNRERHPSPEALQFYSYGEPLFQLAYSSILRLIEKLRAEPRFANFKPDLCFGHSASDALSRRLASAIDPSVPTYFTHARFGNTVSACIPLGMSHAVEDGTLRRGMTVVLLCGSAGFTAAWATLRF